MNAKKVVKALGHIQDLSMDELTFLQNQIDKLKKVKSDTRERIARVLLKKTMHPVCYT
jgi:hypothetical protein